MKIKYLIYFMILIPLVISQGGMLEFTDDDQQQTFVFECDPGLHDSVRVWFKTVDTDTFIYDIVIPPGSIHSSRFAYIAADRDSNGYIIPGHYEGEYWFYEESFLILGGSVLSEDTTHVYVNYDQPTGCSPLRIID